MKGKCLYLVVMEVRQIWRRQFTRENAGPPSGFTREAAEKPVCGRGRPMPRALPDWAAQ